MDLARDFDEAAFAVDVIAYHILGHGLDHGVLEAFFPKVLQGKFD